MNVSTRWPLGLLLLACCNDGTSNPFDAEPAADQTGSTDDDAPPGTADDATGADPSGMDSSGADSEPDTGRGGDGPKLDVGSPNDPIPEDCECGTDEWSYIWIANSTDGTVSKIDTTTLVEEGRYITRSDRQGNPSRTSVSVNARSVAVANRHGGLVKIWARPTFCDEMANGVPGLQTSTGPNDVLPWGQDDCVAWYTPFADWTAQRPVAWSGRVEPADCQDEAVWTAGCGGGAFPGNAGPFAEVEVALVSGLDGSILQSLSIPGYPCSGFGPYGAAVAPDGDLWLVINNGDLARVDADTFETEVVAKDPALQPYGIAVDKDGRVWVSSYAPGVGAGRYDPADATWATVSGFDGQGGVTQSTDGRIWTSYRSAGDGVAWIDPDAATLGGMLPVPGGTVKGVSGDVNGFVWAITGVAHKIDTSTDSIVAEHGGLLGPYTYSDMTGAGIQNVACAPEG